MKATRPLACLTAVIATFFICSAIWAQKIKMDLTPDNFKSQGFTVAATKGDGDMVNILITRDLSKARTFPADSELQRVRRATLEVVGPTGSVARCNLQGEEAAGSVQYSFTIARDYLAHSLVTVSEIDDYKKSLHRAPLIGGGTRFYIKLSDLPQPVASRELPIPQPAIMATVTSEADLGEVELSPQNPKRVSAGDGRDCVIKTTVLPNGDLLLDVTLESKAADGKVQRLGQTKVSLTPGEPSAIIAGSTLVRLTPKLKAQ